MKIVFRKENENLSMKGAFEDFVVSQMAKGVSDKTVETYRSHFKSIGKYLDTEITACRRLFQQPQQFFVRIGFLDCFDLFIVWNIQCRIALPGTPIQEGAEHPQITADGVVRQPALPH